MSGKKTAGFDAQHQHDNGESHHCLEFDGNIAAEQIFDDTQQVGGDHRTGAKRSCRPEQQRQSLSATGPTSYKDAEWVGAISKPATAPTREDIPHVSMSTPFGADAHYTGNGMVLFRGFHRQSETSVAQKNKERRHQDQCDAQGVQFQSADENITYCEAVVWREIGKGKVFWSPPNFQETKPNKTISRPMVMTISPRILGSLTRA